MDLNFKMSYLYIFVNIYYWINYFAVLLWQTDSKIFLEFQLYDYELNELCSDVDRNELKRDFTDLKYKHIIQYQINTENFYGLKPFFTSPPKSPLFLILTNMYIIKHYIHCNLIIYFIWFLKFNFLIMITKI